MAVFRTAHLFGHPRGNWFGTGSDGDIRITSAGAEQSFDGGVTWSTITGWLLVGSVVSIPSVQDGDMVIVNARNLTIDSGYTLTVANRCRGLLIYTTGNCTINGTLSMTARGCHANPADAAVTTDTPVAPGDSNAVPVAGISLRRLAEGQTDTHTDNNLMYGCGLAAVNSEANQPPVDGNGLVIVIPAVGGAGGAYRTWESAGAPGGTAVNGTGGGGSGAVNSTRSGAGSAGTCFSGGSAGAGAYDTSVVTDALPYGGAGSAGVGQAAGGGAGNPGGAKGRHPGDSPGGNGTGGLLIVIARNIAGSGQFQSLGVTGGSSSNGMSGGSSGGGIVALFYSDSYTFTGTRDANGGVAASRYLFYDGGPGGAGSVLGPYKIDPA